MTIEIHQPELEAMIRQRMASGLYESVEALLRSTFDATERLKAPSELVKPSLTAFLKASPLWDSGLTAERSTDTARPVDL